MTDADAAGTYGMVLSLDFARLIAFIYQAGGTITDEGFTTMTLDTDAVKQATEFFVNMDRMALPPSRPTWTVAGAAKPSARAAPP